MDTIFALATPPGRGGVAVVRISGPAAYVAARSIAGDGLFDRSARLRRLSDASGQMIDEGLVLAFSGPASFTGEDVVEFQVHGSKAVIDALLRALSDVPDCRLAEPGEFTRRAFLNGKLDLSEIEGLADLIDAETEAQRRQAQRLLSGALSQQVGVWRAKLVRASALLEASIDFSDEDIPEDILGEAGELLQSVLTDLTKELDGLRVTERVRSGFEVAIVGRPNSGKSTLMNALAGREAAITSAVPGTTRDIIEVHMDVHGFAVTFLDTAGLRDTEDEVEKIGVERGIRRAADADLRIFLGHDVPSIKVEKHDIVLTPKADLLDFPAGSVSGLTGFGVVELLDRLGRFFAEMNTGAGYIVRERHRVAVSEACEHLLSAKGGLSPESLDLVAEEVRGSVNALESLIGNVGVESLLDEIFSSFCLGK